MFSLANKIEKRKLELINKWLNAWTLPGGSHKEMLECYSYETDLEVFAPIQNYYVVKKGGDRDFWDQGEGEIEQQGNADSYQGISFQSKTFDQSENDQEKLPAKFRKTA